MITVDTTIYFLSPIGQVLDIIGVIMVFYYILEPSPAGEIPEIPRGDYEGYERNEETKKRKIKKNAKIGLWLIIIGFSFQIISSSYQTYQSIQKSIIENKDLQINNEK